MFDFKQHSHRRLNVLTGDWVLVSPHRMKRPWQGKVEDLAATNRPAYDKSCYLCPGNQRADGSTNPNYNEPYAFVNDFSALLADGPLGAYQEGDLLVAKAENGICKVICFSPRHDLTLPEMSEPEIVQVINLWQQEFSTLAANTAIRYIQIFENKGDIMGCSNPHPHGQIWASTSVPVEVQKETKQQQNYFEKHSSSLLSAYVELELQQRERVVLENDHFLVVVPFWAVWPNEVLLVSKRHVQQVIQFTHEEKAAFASILKQLTTLYDNLFRVSFPYSAGMHQAPVNAGDFPEWHWHMHFYPPLLRSATVKKFMVGYEMLANPQRDITAEAAAEKLRAQSLVHYKQTTGLPG
jgi:UDPglucose--hexose-1-phosphate uridylyltransferase